MESIAFLLRDFLEMLEGLNCPIRDVCSLGGGSRSDVWMQIKADVCGRKFLAPACSEATAMGAALLALWGAGLGEWGKVPGMELARSYAPNDSHKEDYEKTYGLYKKLYTAVKPLY